VNRTLRAATESSEAWLLEDAAESKGMLNESVGTGA
jgi:hypothetical protein